MDVLLVGLICAGRRPKSSSREALVLLDCFTCKDNWIPTGQNFWLDWAPIVVIAVPVAVLLTDAALRSVYANLDLLTGHSYTECACMLTLTQGTTGMMQPIIIRVMRTAWRWNVRKTWMAALVLAYSCGHSLIFNHLNKIICSPGHSKGGIIGCSSFYDGNLLVNLDTSIGEKHEVEYFLRQSHGHPNGIKTYR